MYEQESLFAIAFVAIFTLLTLLYLNGIILYFVFSVAIIYFGVWFILTKFSNATDLRGQNILITGSTSGIGKELAYLFNKKGCNLILLGRDNERLKQQGKIHSRISNVDILINNAGIAHVKPLIELEENEIEQTMKINLLAHFWMIKVFLPNMISSGRPCQIISVSSIAGIIAMNRIVDYCASKFGVFGMCEALRRELLASNVRIKTVFPWLVNSGMFTGINEFFIPTPSPKHVAECIVEGAMHNVENIFIPGILSFSHLARVFPPLLLDKLALLSGAVKVSEQMRGRGSEYVMKNVNFQVIK